VKDVKRDASRGGGIVFLDISSKQNQVIDRLGRPDNIHIAERLGVGCCFLLPQELTHALTRSCVTPSLAIERNNRLLNDDRSGVRRKT
jgi:hypothetical protein